MLKRLDLYKCEACGNIVEVMHGAAGKLVCCGEGMSLYTENTVEAAVEKHKPVVTRTSDGYEVVVGSVLHPMSTEHFIEWVELIVGDKVFTKFFKEGEEPKVTFKTESDENVYARAYCNLHGHWKS